MDREGGGMGKELRGLIIRVLYQNVRRSSAFALAEIKKEPHITPACLTGLSVAYISDC